METFEDNFFIGKINQFSGSGGEILIKGSGNNRMSRMEVGDSLIGIGIAETIRNFDRQAGSKSIHKIGVNEPNPSKLALRAFRIATKTPRLIGFEYTFSSLSPAEYSNLVKTASKGAVTIPQETIPEGTFVLSFIDSDTKYTLKNIGSDLGANWAIATQGERHWNVGIGKSNDFWMARFPSDNIGILKSLPQWLKMGGIWFGLSLLPGSKGAINLKPVPHHAPISQKTTHHFCLEGKVTGSRGSKSQFPINLRTKITFCPIKMTGRRKITVK